MQGLFSACVYACVRVYTRKAARDTPAMRFTIQYFRNGKRPKPLRFDLASFDEARQVAQTAAEFPEAAIRSLTITSVDGWTETWFYCDGAWRQKRR
jgi:hypothetical protein